jgi:hypothetical protein
MFGWLARIVFARQGFRLVAKLVRIRQRMFVLRNRMWDYFTVHFHFDGVQRHHRHRLAQIVLIPNQFDTSSNSTIMANEIAPVAELAYAAV